MEGGFAVEDQVFKAEGEDAGGVQPAQVVAIAFDDGGGAQETEFFRKTRFLGVDSFNRRINPRFHRGQGLVVVVEHVALLHVFRVENLGDDPIARVAVDEEGRAARPGDGGEPGFFGVQVAVADVAGAHGAEFGEDAGVGKFAIVFKAVDGGEAGVDERAEFGQAFENLDEQV